MKRRPVTSSVLASVGYDEEAATLEVEFVSGSVYQYLGVPGHVYAGLMAADSHGVYFNAEIRDAGFGYVQIRRP